MESKLKQRMVGVIIVIALLLIFVPTLMIQQDTGSTKISLQAKIPPRPDKPVVKVADQTTTIELDENSNAQGATHLPGGHLAATQNLTPQQSAANSVQTIASPKSSAQAKASAAKTGLKTTNTQGKNAQAKASTASSASVDIPIEASAWVVQLGSFADPANAQALIKTLRDKGFAAYTQTTKNSKGKVITRVLVGPEVQKLRAQDLLASLNKQLQLKGVLAPYNPIKTQAVIS